MVFRKQDLVYFYEVCLSRAVARSGHTGEWKDRERAEVGLGKDKQSGVLIIRAEAEGQSRLKMIWFDLESQSDL